MPSKPQSKASTQTGEVNFVLKHRIVGAGFLLFFGALVLPWLLGPPSEAFKLSDDRSTEAEQVLAIIEKNGEQPVEQKRPIPEQEQTYISKITPLDGGVGAQSSNSTNSAAKKLPVDDKPDGGSSKPAEGTSKPAKGTSKPAKGTSKPAEGSIKSAEGSTVAGNPVPATAISTTPKVDVGWVVQVGVFTDKRGAVKVVDDLRDKGFNPSTSIVDTNRGKATGTRIWLGPYAQRVEAAKAKSQLTGKTGEAGFIRAYP